MDPIIRLISAVKLRAALVSIRSRGNSYLDVLPVVLSIDTKRCDLRLSAGDRVQVGSAINTENTVIHHYRAECFPGCGGT